MQTPKGQRAKSPSAISHASELPPLRRLLCGAGLITLLVTAPGAIPTSTPVQFAQITASGVADANAMYPDLTLGCENTSPSLSDAGDIAFISDADLVPKGSVPGASGNADGSDELFLFHADDPQPLMQLTNDPRPGLKASATISRDGGAVAFVWGRPSSTETLPLPHVYLYLVASRRMVRLTEAGGNYGFTAVSDGAGNRYRVAFTRFRPGGPRIFTVDVTRGAASDAVPLSARSGRDPSMSRDGKKIAYTTDLGLGLSQVVLHTVGVGETVITDGEEASGRARISADGRAVAFESRANLARLNRDGNREIFLYQSKSGRVVQITRTAKEVRNGSPTINADGSRVAFLSNGNLVGRNADGNEEIFLWIAGTPPQLRQVTNTKDEDAPTNNGGPYLIGDGRRLLFRSHADLDRRNGDRSPGIFLASGL
jgi:Tol biopolymer transport system component